MSKNCLECKHLYVELDGYAECKLTKGALSKPKRCKKFEPKMTCTECQGTGIGGHDDGDEFDCTFCEGQGVIESEQK